MEIIKEVPTGEQFGMAPTSGSSSEDASGAGDETGSTLTVTSTTAKPNEDTGNGVLGGIVTRLVNRKLPTRLARRGPKSCRAL
ncbi:hypothetical protein [Collinsella aerofaciens]|uniref:hypothetical protein n=1 Tax=Collinsella aerofaciens TaxID=74426 RepID=UPI00359C8CE7